MNINLEHLNRLLDDYTQFSKDYGYWTAKSEKGDSTLAKKKEDDYLQNIYGKREEIEKAIKNSGSATLMQNSLVDVIESLTAIVSILKNDLDNLGTHNKSDPAVFLLENYRQHLLYIIDRSLKRASLDPVI